MWESPGDKLVWLHAPVCQAEGRGTVGPVSLTSRLHRRITRVILMRLPSCRGFQFVFLQSAESGGIRAGSLPFRGNCLMFVSCCFLHFLSSVICHDKFASSCVFISLWPNRFFVLYQRLPTGPRVICVSLTAPVMMYRK